ncbi:MAG: hypothetical protein F4Z47_07505 [Rhodospirillaceae bacterium]|nr:hypothetical protein [Rhodospirillaceae bacterium]
MSAGDEDSLTGALGQEISTGKPRFHQAGKEIYAWKISYYKLRGRGPEAPEKYTGADGLFQIEVKQNELIVLRKGLPFQAKKNWSRKDKKLVSQCKDMQKISKSGIVIDYTKIGYTACDVQDVIDADGYKTKVKKDGKLAQLGQTLGEEFLGCSIGQQGLYYDTESKKILGTDFPEISTTHIVSAIIVHSEQIE